MHVFVITLLLQGKIFTLSTISECRLDYNNMIIFKNGMYTFKNITFTAFAEMEIYFWMNKEFSTTDDEGAETIFSWIFQICEPA